MRNSTGLWSRTVRSEEPGFYPGCNLLVRRSVLAEVGGFDEHLHGGEDADLAWRVRESGASHGWAPDAVVWHAVRAVSFPDQLRSLPRWAGLPLVVRRHPELRRLAHRRVFWKDSHPAALLALVSLLLSGRDRRALVGVIPLLARRIRAAGPFCWRSTAVNRALRAATIGVLLCSCDTESGANRIDTLYGDGSAGQQVARQRRRELPARCKRRMQSKSRGVVESRAT